MMILLIRVKQLYRILNGLGLFRVFLLAGLGFPFFLYILYFQTKLVTSSFYLIGFFLSVVIAIQLSRKDLHFLRVHFIHYRILVMIEYMLISVPLMVCMILHGQWLLGSLYFLTLPAVSFIEIRIPVKSRNTLLQRGIPSLCFEWKSGIRKNFLLIIFLWITGLCTSFFMAGVPVVIFMLGIFPMTFYSKCEPLQMLIAPESGAGRLLMRKIVSNLVLFTVLTLPLLLAFLLSHAEYWYIPVVEYIIFAFVHAYTILVKYAFYVPEQNFSGSQAFGMIGVMSLFLFFLMPLVWVLSIYFYFKSRKVLEPYLNDYN
jgi:hypothetical protein